MVLFTGAPQRLDIGTVRFARYPHRRQSGRHQAVHQQERTGILDQDRLAGFTQLRQHQQVQCVAGAGGDHDLIDRDLEMDFLELCLQLQAQWQVAIYVAIGGEWLLASACHCT